MVALKTPRATELRITLGLPVARMVGRTEETLPTGCAVISLSQDEDATDEYGFLPSHNC
jgi:hypothetical protein